MSKQNSYTSHRTLHWIAQPLAGLIWLAYLAFHEPGWLSNRYWITGAHPAVSAILSLLTGYGAGWLMTLARAGIPRLKSALLPINLRRAVMAAGLMLFTPVMFWGGMPLVPALGLLFLNGLTDESFFTLILPTCAVLWAVWYGVLGVIAAQPDLDRRGRLQSVILIYAGAAAAVYLFLSESYF
ncbi:hypothetical protein [uncultured Tateyamaria sp.]|uniref:hypothetical protein n=1 Tax=Tateyamaria sp. 1078 TaxID=3417464 RepID=UPI0026062BC7|nr:hypothetical protein [uncultured Tateyamaria sp.]